MRPWIALIALAGCNEYDWESALDANRPPAASEGGVATAVDEDEPATFPGEDPAPEFGTSAAVPPTEPGDEDGEGDPELPEDGEEPGTPEDPEDPGDPSTDGDPEDPRDPQDPEEPGTPEDPEDPGDAGAPGRMTGGGSVWDGDERVTHGFQVRCDPARRSNLEINWDGGRNFHLDELVSVACWDDPALDPGSPSAGFDTLWALGVGSLDGVDGVTIELLLTDDGERGDGDAATFVIGADLDVSSFVDMGNHQAHGGATMPPPAGGVPTAEELMAAGLPVPEEDGAAAGCSTAPGLPAAGALLLGVLGLRRRARH